jgi:NADPH2:quinone reductase
LGADEVIQYKSEDLDARLSELARGGVDVWWETRREPDFDLATKHLAQRGRFILMAGRDARPEFPVGPFYVKGCSLHGFVMFAATPEEQRACSTDINIWLASGQLKPRIDRVMPLSQAAAAHRLQEDYTVRQQGSLSGKIVLVP